jgi:hypothetical protein
MIDYAAILSCRYQGKEWTLDGDDYTGLTWLSDGDKPTKDTLDSLWTEVQAEILSSTAAKAAQREALLQRLGITAEEAALLLGGI